ncbi:hypothetical protein DFH11DRAFT_1639845 [Phellopilus nigrolimitatus]|nr:hypothetical protein DFH11DRAFT_1639845 [Phellopilus nigrolimitatus]
MQTLGVWKLLVCSHAPLSTCSPFSSLTGHPHRLPIFPRSHRTPHRSGHVVGCNPLALRARFGSTGFYWYAVISCVQRDSPDSRTRPELIGRRKHVGAKLCLLYSPAALAHNIVGTKAIKADENLPGRMRRGICSYTDCLGSVV